MITLRVPLVADVPVGMALNHVQHAQHSSVCLVSAFYMHFAAQVPGDDSKPFKTQTTKQHLRRDHLPRASGC